MDSPVVFSEELSSGSPSQPAGENHVLDDVNDSAKDDSTEDDIQSILAMRKNLTVAFDKHATEGAVAKKGIITKPPLPPPQPAHPPQTKAAKRGQKRPSSSSISMESATSQFSTVSSSSTSSSKRGRLLSVYLRIRPPSSPTTPSTSSTSEALHGMDSTIEVFHDDASSCAIESCPPHPTKVRTYPPVTSQAYKSMRQSQDSPHLVNRNGVKEYRFNRVFGSSSSQEEVYNNVARPLVEGLFPRSTELDSASDGNDRSTGRSALLFAYGITNAGKTYTVMGKSGAGNDRYCGILPRAMRDILDEVGRRRASAEQYELQMSFFEIYNEQIYDLIGTDTNDESKKSSMKSSSQKFAHRSDYGSHHTHLKLRESKDGHIFVQDLSKHRVNSVTQGVELALAAKNRRRTSSNNLNGESSRSHCICQLEVVPVSGAPPLNDSHPRKNHHPVTMWIVDLAGSERAKRTSLVHGTKRQREAVQINASLMNLMQCLQQLHNNQNPNTVSAGKSGGTGVVPFRGSKLSHLFMNHLTGSSVGRTAMIVNVNPIADDFDETQHVLSYAAVARNVKISNRDLNGRAAPSALNSLKKDAGRICDGRAAKASTQDDSPPRKIAKIAAKLSPRAMLGKKREMNTRKKTENHVGTIKSSDTFNVGFAKQGSRQPKATKSTSLKKMMGKSQRDNLLKKNQALEEENKTLLKRLEEARKQLAAAQSESAWMKKELVQQESKIRVEVGEEWEEQMAKMRDEYETARRLQQKVAPTPARSERKIRLDKAEEVIDELLDQITECEEEMERMREVHSKTKELHKSELLAKDVEIQNLLKLHQESMAKDRELQQSREEFDVRLEMANSASVDEGEQLEITDEFENNSADPSPHNASVEQEAAQQDNVNEDLESGKEEKEDLSKKVLVGSAQNRKRMRRLPRGRCSEVACISTSPKSSSTPAPSSSSKKKGRLLRSTATKAKRSDNDVRSPLRALASENVQQEPCEKDQSDSDSSPDLQMRMRARALQQD